MKTIHFLSNVVVNPIHNKIEKILENDFHVSCSDLNQVEQFLLSDVKVDILVVILTSKYFFQTNEYENIEEKLGILLSLLTNYKEKNEASILLSNLWDSSSSVSFQEADRAENNDKIVQANRKIFKYAGQLTSFQVLNIFNLAKKIGDDNFYRRKMDFLYQMPFSENKFLIGSFILLLAVAEIKEPLLYSGVASRMFIFILVYGYFEKIAAKKLKGFHRNNLNVTQSARLSSR